MAKDITNISSRAPVVVVMGHVDHGKTTLLDTIRKTDVASREQGGITQKIGAYQVTVDGGKVTFIDTPGHEAFTKMRSQGAMVADIAVLVVAANDSVMPQTLESIKIIQQTKIPCVVAINKVDLPEANVNKVIQDLVRHNFLLENYGGEIPFVKLSAKTGDGVKELLEIIKLLSDINGLTGSSEGELLGTVIEAKLDKAKGVVATAIIKDGTLNVGEKIFVDSVESKIRALIDYQGKNVNAVVAGEPVEILGLNEIPAVGAIIARTAKNTKTGIDNGIKLHAGSEDGLKLILRADTVGSLEAIINSLPESVVLISSATGDISESDIMNAKTTKSIVLGFNVKAGSEALKLAENDKILVRTYKIIYELLEELEDAANGELETHMIQKLGTGQILAQFPFDKLVIAGTKVVEGRMAKGDKIQILRGEEVIGESKIKSLRIGKDETNKAEVGKECGILLDPQIEFRPGDTLISIR